MNVEALSDDLSAVLERVQAEADRQIAAGKKVVANLNAERAKAQGQLDEVKAFIRGEKHQKSEVSSRSTSRSSEVTPTRNSGDSSSVVRDKAAIALEHLLSKRPA